MEATKAKFMVGAFWWVIKDEREGGTKNHTRDTILRAQNP